MKTKRIEEVDSVDDCDSSKDELSDILDNAQDYGKEQKKKVGKWTIEEDSLLHIYVPKYGEKSWRKISQHIPGRTSIQCLHRWSKILKPGLVKGPWTAEEDEKLKIWVSREGPTKWAQASGFINGRSGKQCRERWFNTLNPNVKKGNWSQEEDKIIFDLYQKYGSSWSKIARFIPGRTENAIKNRFYSTVRKLASDKKKLSEDFINENLYDEGEALENDQEETVNDAKQDKNNLYKLLQGKKIPDLNEVKNKDIEKQANKQNIEQINETHTFDKMSCIEVEEYDTNFENFILKLNSSSSRDFPVPVQESRRSLDLGYLDDLQDKILNYCNSNIQNLASALKAFNNINNHKLPLPMLAEKIEKQPESTSNTRYTEEVTSGGGPVYHKKIKNIQISAPIPITHIGPKKNLKPIENQNSHANTKVQQASAKNDTAEERFKSQQQVLSAAASALGNLQENINSNDSEQRMTSLFQQLRSLEDLLKNAKSELLKLENSFDGNENKENIDISKKENFIKATSSKNTNDGEEIYKKRRLNSRF